MHPNVTAWRWETNWNQNAKKHWSENWEMARNFSQKLFAFGVSPKEQQTVLFSLKMCVFSEEIMS